MLNLFAIFIPRHNGRICVIIHFPASENGQLAFRGQLPRNVGSTLTFQRQRIRLQHIRRHIPCACRISEIRLTTRAIPVFQISCRFKCNCSRIVGQGVSMTTFHAQNRIFVCSCAHFPYGCEIKSRIRTLGFVTTKSTNSACRSYSFVISYTISVPVIAFTDRAIVMTSDASSSPSGCTGVYTHTVH